MACSDHQNHSKSLVQQQAALSQEIEQKRNMLFKVTGAIEYLTEIGVTLPKEEETTVSEETSEPEVVQ